MWPVPPSEAYYGTENNTISTYEWSQEVSGSIDDINLRASGLTNTVRQGSDLVTLTKSSGGKGTVTIVSIIHICKSSSVHLSRRIM